MKCDIITIGDELLIGQVVDTNSAVMAQMLAGIGVDVHEKITIGDTREQIFSALRRASAEAGLVLMTGGLGPTRDDITKSTLAEYWHDRLVRDEASYRNVERFLAERHLEMNALNERQAWVPSRAEVLPNACGSAPGMWFEQDGVVYVSMPGVPHEMVCMMRQEVLPRIASRLVTQTIVHRTLVLSGIPESRLALVLSAWEDQLPANMKLAYLPDAGVLRLRLTAKGPREEPVAEAVEAQLSALRPLLGPYLLGEDVQRLEEIVGLHLLACHAMLATAESCTGGNVARRITSVPGSSAYFAGSVVAYSNRVKTEVLHVAPETLETHGAVSRETVLEMVAGVRQLLQTDYAVAISGIAGPDGGTPEKPVGTVWIAAASPDNAEARCFQFPPDLDRQSIVERSTNAALRMVLGMMPQH